MTKIQFENGTTVEFDGDPTPQDVEEVVKSLNLSQKNQDTPVQSTGNEKQNAIGQTFNVPGAAIRSAMLGTGYIHGATQPSSVPTFSELAAQKVSDMASKLPRPLVAPVAFVGSSIGQLAGQAVDPATYVNPLTILGLGASTTASKAAIGSVVNSPVGKAVGNFITKKRELPNPSEFVSNALQNLSNVKDPVDFAQSLRSNIFIKKQAMGEQFQQGIIDNMAKYPKAKVDLKDEFYGIKGAIKNIEENPGFSSQIKSIISKTTDPKKGRLLQKLIDNPDEAANLTLKEAQDIKTAINQAPAISSKLKQGKFAQYTPADLELLDLSHSVTAKQVDAFPEFAQTKGIYKDYIQNYNQVKNSFKPSVFLNKIRNGFGNEEVEKALKMAIGEDNYNSIKGFQNTTKLINAGKKIGVGAAGVVGSAVVGKKIWDIIN